MDRCGHQTDESHQAALAGRPGTAGHPYRERGARAMQDLKLVDGDIPVTQLCDRAGVVLHLVHQDRVGALQVTRQHKSLGLAHRHPNTPRWFPWRRLSRPAPHPSSSHSAEPRRRHQRWVGRCSPANQTRPLTSAGPDSCQPQVPVLITASACSPARGLDLSPGQTLANPGCESCNPGLPAPIGGRE